MQVDFFEVIKDRKEIRRLVSMANKRINRLKKSGLEDSPALTRFVPDRGKFSIKGLKGNELRTEVAALRKFLQAQTSTIRGYDRVLKGVAKSTGIKFNRVRDIRTSSSRFFELASKTEQYLRNVEGTASAIGYQAIWEAINVYNKKGGDFLMDVEVDVEGLIKQIVEQVDIMNKGKKQTEEAELEEIMKGFTFLG